MSVKAPSLCLLTGFRNKCIIYFSFGCERQKTLNGWSEMAPAAKKKKNLQSGMGFRYSVIQGLSQVFSSSYFTNWLHSKAPHHHASLKSRGKGPFLSPQFARKAQC
jgi:hypothetical protein